MAKKPKTLAELKKLAKDIVMEAEKAKGEMPPKVPKNTGRRTPPPIPPEAKIPPVLPREQWGAGEPMPRKIPPVLPSENAPALARPRVIPEVMPANLPPLPNVPDLPIINAEVIPPAASFGGIPSVAAGLGSLLYSPNIGQGSDMLPIDSTYSGVQVPYKKTPTDTFWEDLFMETMNPKSQVPWKVQVGDLSIEKKKPSNKGEGEPANIPSVRDIGPQPFPTVMPMPAGAVPGVRPMSSGMPAVQAVPITPMPKVFYPKSLEDFKKVNSR